MEPFWLVVLETPGIQRYVFGSNRLRENVGASHLVYLATTGWLLQSPDEFLPSRHNIADGRRQDDVGVIETGELDAELLYAGGGNTVILFRCQESARTFAETLSIKLLQEAPGLEVVLVSEPVKWDSSLAQGMQRAMQRLAAKKSQREVSQPLLGLGVTAACQSTGLVANHVEPEPGEVTQKLTISAEVRAKWQHNEPAKDRLERELLQGQSAQMEFPDQFDHLGRTEGESSYIAVVHADGNGMGKVLRSITGRYVSVSGIDNRSYVQELREFSDMANLAGLNALHKVVDQVKVWNTDNVIEPARVGDKTYFSIRPLVYGGDDVTYVCDGRIGLQTAQIFLKAFQEQPVLDERGNRAFGVAAAGVAIVKVRYPFARAYQLSEQLCKNAKALTRNIPTLDWHLAQSGLFGDLGEIRRIEYDEKWNDDKIERSLLMRPVVLGNRGNNDWHTWPAFSTLVHQFCNRQEWPRNKVMTLREALRAGPYAVSSFVTNYGRELPDVGIVESEYRKTGWESNRCVYFDAIEMIDQEVFI